MRFLLKKKNILFQNIDFADVHEIILPAALRLSLNASTAREQEYWRGITVDGDGVRTTRLGVALHQGYLRQAVALDGARLSSNQQDFLTHSQTTDGVQGRLARKQHTSTFKNSELIQIESYYQWPKNKIQSRAVLKPGNH